MSGSVRRRHSKWDHKSSEDLPVTPHDRSPLRRHREPSPNRGLRRQDNRSKERVISWDRERNSSRVSPGPDERSNQHRSRSPRNGWGRSYRGSRSRSQSRSRSPAHHLRRETATNDRGRSRAGVSAQICRDFAVERCKRGDQCQFLHQNDQSYDRRRPLECSSPDDWEGRHQRTGASRYSPIENKDYDSRTEKSVHVCKEFLKGNCRRGTSCRYVHHDTVADVFQKEPVGDVRRDIDRDRDRIRDRENDHRTRNTYHRNYDHEPADVFEKVPIDDVYRGRDVDCRSRDTYKNRDCEPHKRGHMICKFFASGNCRNGNRCRFSHEVQERFSPEKSQDDRRGIDHKLVVGGGWDEPRWSDVAPASNGPPLQDWKEEKNEVTVVAEQVTAAKSADDLWSHEGLIVKDSWTAPPTNDEFQTQNENSSLQWHTENNVLGMSDSSSRGAEIFSDGRETGGFQDQKLYNDAFTAQNSNRTEDKSTWSHGEGRNVTVNNDGSSVLQSPTMNTATYQGFSQNFQSVNGHTFGTSPAGQSQIYYLEPSEGGRIQPSHVPSVFVNPAAADGPHLMNATSHGHTSAIATSPTRQGQTQFSVQPSERGTMQESQGPIFLNSTAADRPLFVNATSSGHAPAIATSPVVQGQTQFSFQHSDAGGMQESHNPSFFLDTTAADEPHLMNTSSSGHASSVAAGLGNVSSEQLVQLSHLSASLAQLLDSRQQLPQLSSNITPSGMSKLPDAVALVPPASSSIMPQNQAPELPRQQYVPISDSIEPKVHSSGDFVLPSGVEQKAVNDELNNDGNNVNELEPVAASKGDEDMEKAFEKSSKAPENKPSEDMLAEDGADDDKKTKDSKAIRPFKFALAEFVKELLKPSWKDGQVNKDSYKVIVKKVVDKIIETQGLQIPQTKEKISQYLSTSKPKIEKLVQAYVGRYQRK